VSDAFVDSGTTFRRFKTRAARSCNGCRKRIDGCDSAWKPTKENHGSWKPDAVLCEACVDKKRKEASSG
jgi:hypothetical protein